MNVLDRRQAHVDAVLQRHGVFTVPAGWVRRAACRGADTEEWFGQRQLSQAICDACGVRDVCLLAALDEESDLDTNLIFGRRWIPVSHRCQFLRSIRNNQDQETPNEADPICGSSSDPDAGGDVRVVGVRSRARSGRDAGV